MIKVMPLLLLLFVCTSVILAVALKGAMPLVGIAFYSILYAILTLVLITRHKIATGTYPHGAVYAVVFLLVLFIARTLKLTLQTYRILLFLAWIYVSISFGEWYLHRYVMHCKQPNQSAANPLQAIIVHTCKAHRVHHLEVNKDMSLSEKISEAHGLYLNHLSFIPLMVLILLSLFSFNMVLNLKFSVRFIVTASFVSILTYMVAWNVLHKAMHMKMLRNLHFENHALHHQIKGSQKGNFNIIFFGTDAIMGTLNSSIS